MTRQIPCIYCDTGGQSECIAEQRSDLQRKNTDLLLTQIKMTILIAIKTVKLMQVTLAKRGNTAESLSKLRHNVSVVAY